MQKEFGIFCCNYLAKVLHHILIFSVLFTQNLITKLLHGKPKEPTCSIKFHFIFGEFLAIIFKNYIRVINFGIHPASHQDSSGTFSKTLIFFVAQKYQTIPNSKHRIHSM